MNDYTARGGVVFTATTDASWKNTLQQMQADNVQFASEASRAFERIKGPEISGLERWDTMLNRIVDSLAKAVRTGSEFSTTVGSRLTNLHQVYSSIGASDRAGIVHEAQQFVKNWSLPDTKAWEAQQQHLADAYRSAHYTNQQHDAQFLSGLSYGVVASSRTPGAYAGQHAAADQYMARQSADSDRSYYAEQQSLADNYHRQRIQSEREFYAEQAQLANQFFRIQQQQQDSLARNMTSNWRDAHDGKQSDWMAPHYGKFLNISQEGMHSPTPQFMLGGGTPGRPSWMQGPQFGPHMPNYPLGAQYDWRTQDPLAPDPNAGNPYGPDKLGPMGTHNFAASTDPFWSRKSGSAKWKGSPDAQNEHRLRNANFAGQQLAYGIDDAIQSYQFGGAAASIRAASNNLTAIAGTTMSGPVGVAAVIGLSAVTAIAAHAASTVGNDSPWAKLGTSGTWDTDPRNPINVNRVGGLGVIKSAAGRTMDMWFGAGSESLERETRQERIRLEDREYDMKRSGVNALLSGRESIRTTDDFHSGTSLHRNYRDSVIALEAKRGEVAEERFAAQRAGIDTGKIEDLEKEERALEKQLVVQKKLRDEANAKLPLLEKEHLVLRDANIETDKTDRLVEYRKSKNEYASPEAYLNAKIENRNAEVARIKALGLPADKEKDLIRAVNDRSWVDHGMLPDVRRAFEDHRRDARRSHDDYMFEGSTFDSISRNREKYQRGIWEDNSLGADLQLRLVRESSVKEGKDRADYLFAQRESWRVKPAGWTQRDENMEVYGARLKEIEESKTMTGPERARQMRAAKESFDDANKKADIPSGRRNFSTDSFADDSREDVRYEAFYTRKQSDVAADLNNAGHLPKPVLGKRDGGEAGLAKQDEANGLLKSIDRGIRGLNVATRTA